MFSPLLESTFYRTTWRYCPDPGTVVRSGLLLLLLLAPLVPVAAESDTRDPERRRHLTLLVTSGLAGRLEAADGSTIDTMVATIRHLAKTARAAGHGVAILDAGRTLAPYAESRFDAGETMSAALATAGARAFVPGPIDLDLQGADATERAVVGLAASQPFCVLRGFSGGPSGLDRLADWAALSPFPDLELVVAGRLDPTYIDDLSGPSGEATSLDPDEVFERADPGHQALRLLVSHAWAQDGTMTGRTGTWNLLEGNPSIDLIFDPDLGQNLVLERLGDSGSVFLVGRQQEFEDPWSVAEIVLELQLTDGRWAPDSARLEIHEADASLPGEPSLERKIGEHLAAFRRDGAQRFPAGVASPDSFCALQELVLEAMGERAAAEVVILNRGALRPVAESQLTCCPPDRETVRRLLSIDQYLEVVELTGKQLRDLYEESEKRTDPTGAPRPNALLFNGLTVEGSSYEVNGRELRDEDLYQVAINTFLGRGGDNYSILAEAAGRVVAGADGRPLEIRDDVVIPRLARPDEPFVDLGRKGLWRYGVDKLTFSFDGVDTSADPAYQDVSDSRASADDSSTLHTTLELRADQEWEHFSWENVLEARLRLIDDSDGSVNEAEDDLRFESSGVFTRTRWLGARPYASLIVDSELRANRNSEGQPLPRQLEINLTGGLRWKLPRWPQIRVGWQARRQEDTEEADLLGVFAEAEWKWPLGGDAGPALSGSVYTERMVDSERTLERLDLEIELLFELTEHLSLTPAFNLYLYADSRLPGHAEYHRFSIGLTYRWSGKHQRR